MKTILSSILFLLMIASYLPSSLASANTPEEIAEDQTKQMVQIAGLRPEQARKVKAINLEYARKIWEAKSAGASQVTLNRLNYQHTQKLKEVLTPNQLRIYQRSLAK